MDTARIEDYLNDKIQTFADFDTLDNLLTSVQSQQILLKKQLEAAELDVRECQDESASKAAQARQSADAFESRQADIDKRLLIITQSDSVEDATARFKPLFSKVHNLEVAEEYLGMLEDVERLRLSALEHQKAAPDAALASYQQLSGLLTRVQSLQQAADGAAPHLVDHIEAVAASVKTQLRESFAADLNVVLNKILWPKKSTALPASLAEDFNSAVGHLLQLQKPELENLSDAASSQAGYHPLPVILPLEILVEPLATRFKYHFSGDRPTNRVDKPEYFFAHFLDILQTHSPFVSEYMQPVFFAHLRDTSLLGLGNALEVTPAFIAALLPMLETKIATLLSQVSKQPQHLSHLIHELMKFDSTLREEWHYDGATGRHPQTWGGLCWEVLTSEGWFDHWLQVEHDFALARYQTIVDDPSALVLDYDSVSTTASKPTSAAIRVFDLISTITQTYRPLLSLSQKLRFLVDIQITILDRFHDRLRSALQAFESKTSTVGRTVQGVSASELADLQGVSGLDRLCRVFGSAEHLEKAMRDWSDDIFFLDLWNQLQARVRSNERGKPIAGSFAAADIAAKTSSTLVDSSDADEIVSGALFDETAGSYAQLRERTEGLIVTTLRRGATESLGPFFRNAGYASSLTGELSESELTPSSSLAATLSSLRASLDFLSRAVSPHAMRRMSKAIARIIDDLVLDRAIFAKDFSLQGAHQLTCDLSALSGVFDRFISHGPSLASLRRCREAAILLRLDANQQHEEQNATQQPSLWSVERKVFASNEDARAALMELELSALTEGEARKVLKCRVELT